MGSQTRQRQKAIKVWVSDEEKRAIEAHADACALSASNYLRNLGMNAPIPSQLDRASVVDLSHTAGDIGRLGGLLKRWLSHDERFRPGLPSRVDVQALYRELTRQGDALREHVKRITP